MESLLQGIPRVAVYFDDIIVTRANDQEHLATLREVLSRILKAGLHLKWAKCGFLLDEVEYLGHKVTAQGLLPLQRRIKAIQEAPAPTDVKQLQAFLGMLNYYGRFLPSLSTVLAPL